MEQPSASSSKDPGDTLLAHVVDYRVLLAVFAALIILTVITVAVSYFDFGPFNLIVALSIATFKAVLVAGWFMHLRYDNRLNAFIFLVGIVFLGLFLIIAMLDAVQYQPNIQSWEQSRQ
jgi:cytochrome c oxidase subunit IV